MWPDLTLGKTFKNIVQTFESLFFVWQNFELTFANFINFGQIWVVVSSQIIKNNLAIWSHCQMTRLFSNVLPFISMKIYPMAYKIYQSTFKRWWNNPQKFPKDFLDSPKVANFCQICSHCHLVPLLPNVNLFSGQRKLKKWFTLCRYEVFNIKFIKVSPFKII